MRRAEGGPNDNGKKDSLADDWLSIASEVPFSSNAPIKPPEKPELEKPLALAKIRQIHIDYLSGTYEPTLEEWDLILDDETFYESDEYIAYKKQELDKISAEHTDVYAPSDEKIRLTIEPFVNSTRQDIGKLLQTGSKLDDELSEGNVLEIINFFAEKYGIQDVPSFEFVHEGSVSGSYNGLYNNIKIKINKTNSTVNYIETIAHEMWHAYQHQHENEEYKINLEHYYSSSMDFDAYANQLVEKEAFAIEDAIGDLYRKADLEMHPEKIPDLREKYQEWLSYKYEPNETEDGVDYRYLILAHNEFAKPNPVREIWTRLRKKFRKEKK